MNSNRSLMLIYRIFFSVLMVAAAGKMVANDDDCDSKGACCTSCSRSFLRHRPASQDMALQYALDKYFLDYQKDADIDVRKKEEACALNKKISEKKSKQANWKEAALVARENAVVHPRFFTVQSTLFYSHSQHAKQLARYFLKEGKECLLVAQTPEGTMATPVPTDPVNDINSWWLNVAGPSDPDLVFSSNVSLAPKRKVIGLAWNVHFDLDEYLHHTWLEFFLPLVHVRHTAHLRETNIKGRGSLFPPFSNATDAFNNDAWCYGKIPVCTKTKTGLDDVKITFGWDFVKRQRIAASLYGNLFVPTFNASKARYLFEPTIGTGGHVGLGAGINFDCNVYDNGEFVLNWLADFRYAYFFSHRERRSLDLCANGEWSRYMLVAKKHAASLALSYPAINYLTRDVDVTPRSNVEFLTLLHLEHKRFNIELGYNFWWRQEESLELSCAMPDQVGIYDITQRVLFAPAAVSTASKATIEQAAAAPVDPTPTYIANQDFNLNSGRVPSSMTSKLFVALGYDLEWRNRPILLGGGFSYEFAQTKASYQQWSVFFKNSLSF